MKKNIKLTIVVLIILIITGLALVNKQSSWKTYKNIDPSFSFSYPNSWGDPRLFNDKEKTKFGIDFGNYSFYINNGYYFMDINGKRPTITELVASYKIDMENKNEVKDFRVDNIMIDNHKAIKVSVDNIVGSQYKDIYIYEDMQNPDKFILITSKKDFVDDVTLNKILSTFKFN